MYSPRAYNSLSNDKKAQLIPQPGMRVTVMGLGTHGGGLETVSYLLSRGADLVVTDLKDEGKLAPTLEQIDDKRIRFVLGHHEERDFSSADMVVKNPAVPRRSPYLATARRVETDISLFLREIGVFREIDGRRPTLVAWTGSKGKSTTAAATAHIVSNAGLRCRLAGNITVSPLRYVDDDLAASVMVLELSSFQLGDLAFAAARSPVPFPPLSAFVAGITNIFPDHQDYYGSMEDYVADKRLIYADQSNDAWTVVGNDSYGRDFATDTPAKAVPLFDVGEDAHGPGGAQPGGAEGTPYHAFADPGAFYHGTEQVFLLPPRLLVSGPHNRRNVTAAAVAAYLAGVPAAAIPKAAASFTGIPHRLEYLGRIRGADIYNDTAATIPQATLRSLQSFARPVHLVLGGTDKNLDLSVMPSIAEAAASIHLLDGSATRRMLEALGEDTKGGAATTKASGVAPRKMGGPFADLESAVRSAVAGAAAGDVVLFSPGAASFELFHHEFHRGEEFKRVCHKLGLEPPTPPPLQSTAPAPSTSPL